MLLTVWIYAAFHGLPFAIGFVAMLLVHEMGHYLAARQRGLDPHEREECHTAQATHPPALCRLHA